MKVNFINSAWCNSSLKYNNSQNIAKYNTKYLSLPKDTVSFQKSSDIPPEVIAYLNTKKDALGKSNDCLFLYDYKKLEGIQNGIDVFEGLSLSQIAYIIQNLNAVMLQRGCNNACLYCFADAKTPYHMKVNNLTDKMDFEDYENLLNGFKEINKRLGFNAFAPSIHDYQSLFHDADCSKIYLRDKNGNTYDYADLAKMLYDVTGHRIIFDTAGWELNDKTTQKRMEDLVQKVLNSNEYDFLEFNISINPFHSIYNRSVELIHEGRAEKNKDKIKKGYELREIYTDRMANVIFTFSPLLDKTSSIKEYCMLDFLFRALFDETELDGYQKWALESMREKIFDKLKKLYQDDLISDNPKVIKSEEQMEKYIDYLSEEFLHKKIGGVNLCNQKLINKLDGISAGEYNIVEKHSFNSALEGCYFDAGLIDVNGKFYMTNFIETYPTDIVLNFKNKDERTAPIAPNLRDDVITKEIIEKA